MNLTSHLQALEEESIYILREVAAEFARPVLLYSMGKDSSVMLRLALKAFHPAKPPFALLHVDTTYKFREMIEFRDRVARELGLELIVHTNRDGVERGADPFRLGTQECCRLLKTAALLDAIACHGIDAAIGGARREEEESRANERVFSFRNLHGQRDPRNQRPELWSLYNGRIDKGESIRVFPLSNWTELDVWEYIEAEQIPVASLYFAKPRTMLIRDGMLISVDRPVAPQPGDRIETVMCRMRSLGCSYCTGAIPSQATTVAEIIAELTSSRRSERENCVIEQDQESSMQLRLVTAGGAGDGKSTLIGRMLYDNMGVCENQVDAVRKSSAGSTQGIAIDVAYRHFRTPRRRFIIADAPGDEQYTRNMATGASTAELAVILLDAQKGVLPQSRRHACIAALLGIRHAVVAVNKMDLVAYSQTVFDRIRADFTAVLEQLKFEEPCFIPVHALEGDNVTSASVRTPWYGGPTLLHYLETVPLPREQQATALRFPVQYVVRGEAGFRGFAGRVAAGRIRPGDPVRVWPSGQDTTVAEIVTFAGPIGEAASGARVALRLSDHLDVSRGDLLADPDRPPIVSRSFRATLFWMSDAPLHCDVPYLLKHTTRQVCASVRRILKRIDMPELLPVPSQELGLNDIAEVDIETHQPLYFDPYCANRTTGSFILIDMVSNQTVAAGMLREGLESEGPWLPEPRPVSPRGLTVWLTGLSASGKSTIGNAVQTELAARGYKTESLDGDIVRQHLCRGLGFSRKGRDENIRRIGFVAGLLTRNGVIALVSAISPYRTIRNEVKAAIGRFLEVYVNAPLEVCEGRDPKGLYAKARRGELRGFTGVDDPYEPPEHPDVECRTDRETPAESAAKVLRAIYDSLGTQA